MDKKKILVVLISLTLFLSVGTLCTADDPPFPGFPHNFWGTVKNQQGSNLPDGTIIKAIVDNETYYGTVVNGVYGFNETTYPSNPPFFVEDPGNNNAGKPIYFYIGNVNTTQSILFINGGDTRLDLLAPSGNQGGNGGSQPPTPPDQHPPTAHANGPYFGTINTPITFDGSTSNDSDGTIVSYTWSFGDGDNGTTATPSHTYIAAGMFTVILTVVDNDGLLDNDTTYVSVSDDSDGDGWSNDEEARYGTDQENASDYPVDTDGDHIPNVVDMNDDNDDLTDSEEIALGSDPSNNADVTKKEFQGMTFFFVDITRDSQPDIYYNKTTGNSTALSQQDAGVYYVDVNNDGTWDYIYNSQQGTVTAYTEKTNTESPINWMSIIIIIVLVFIVIFIIFIFYHKKQGGKNL